jgi:hypothetical protein
MSFAIVAGAGIAAGGAIGGAVISSNAASDAAEAQGAAADKATDLQRDIYNQNRTDQQPWRQAGISALGQLGSDDYKRDFTMSDFNKDPGYDFRMKQGRQAVERSAAARGGLQSGGTLKAIARYGEDYASNEYDKAYNRFNADRDRRFNRLASLAGVGQTANSQVANAGMNFANQAGANMMGAANAQGAAGIAGANAWGNALGGLGKSGMDYAMLSKFYGGAK